MYIDIELYFILNDKNLHMTCIYMYDIPDMYMCMYVCMSVCSDVSMYLCIYMYDIHKTRYIWIICLQANMYAILYTRY